jgi:hypothetical protein
MLNKINISSCRQKLIVYVVLAVVTLAVFWQMNQYGFVNFDDGRYVTKNSHIQSGITLKGLRWAFSTTYAEFWHPLTWLSLMLDYQLYVLSAGGYHLTNIILHIMSSLLLFWLFNRITREVWKSAFIAAFFALHPLHVESVAWVAERKDVLSAFLGMLTLCLYVYYTEKPVTRRYLPVLLCFACALMSKPMVVTLPVIMILLDYWQLDRLQLCVQKSSESGSAGIIPLWQLWEKIPFFILSAVFSIITFYAHNVPSEKHFPFTLGTRIANAIISFATYLEKTFWPQDLAVFYPFPVQIPAWQVIIASFLIIIISIAAIALIKRLPYLFLGWLWYAVTLLPVSGIIPVGEFAMADRYTYLPLIGIGIMLAWGIPFLLPRKDTRIKILFPAGIAILAILAVLTWRQCGYWKNGFELFNHALQVTKNNYLAYNNRGNANAELGQYQQAIEDYSKAISLRPDSLSYYDRGRAYYKLSNYQIAIEDYSEAIHLRPDYADAFNNRGIAYLTLGNKKQGCSDAQKACELGKCKFLEIAKGQNYCR